MLIALVFAAFFVATTLVLFSIGAPRARELKESRTRLEVVRSIQPLAEAEAVSLRRTESLSGIPWLHRLLLKLQLADALRRLLQQADVRWTVGRLVLLAATAGLAVGVLVYLRTG